MERLKLFFTSLSVLADFMTILGISGIAAWSIFSKDKSPLQRAVARIVAFSVKTAICLFGFLLCYLIARGVYIGIVILVNGRISSNTVFWDSTQPIGYILAYSIAVFGIGVLFLLFCAVVYSWSSTRFVML